MADVFDYIIAAATLATATLTTIYLIKQYTAAERTETSEILSWVFTDLPGEW